MKNSKNLPDWSSKVKPKFYQKVTKNNHQIFYHKILGKHLFYFQKISKKTKSNTLCLCLNPQTNFWELLMYCQTNQLKVSLTPSNSLLFSELLDFFRFIDGQTLIQCYFFIWIKKNCQKGKLSFDLNVWVYELL